MLKVYNTILCLLVAVSQASCDCPIDEIIAIDQCEFRMTCISSIRGLQLPSKCLESSNYPVIVHVNLNEAIDRLDNNDIDLLKSITSLKVSANWKATNLAILQYTSKLQTLYLSHIGIEKIISAPFYYLYYLEDLDLSYNKLTDIRELFEFKDTAKLRKLSLAHNIIEDVPGSTFEDLTSLKELDLSYNAIHDLTEEPFANLTNLEILKLNNNKIKDLNGALNNLWNLNHLYLRGNYIQNVDDESLKIIEHLQTFDVSRNELENLKPVMFSRHWDHFDNHSLCKIILSENHISLVPNATIKEISYRYGRIADKHSVDILTELDLSMNYISIIEYNAFQSLIRIVSLDLSKNKIDKFIVNTDHLTFIKFLNLSSNSITHLYFESFSSMNNLQKLDLSYNKLDLMPDLAFNNNYHLKVVNMTFNEIEKLNGIHIKMFHSDGGILDLSNNKLYKLIVPYGEGIRLVTLILHANNITDTTRIDLRQQTDLQNLDMTKNFVQELNMSSLLLPTSLMNLDLSFNRISRIGPSAFHNLGRLQTLRLGHNQLSQLEYGSFEGLPLLKSLDLSYNGIKFLDSKLLMDLKSLQFLSVRSNDMNFLDCRSWYGHKFDLLIYVDNNKLSCDWLAKAMNDFNNGYSRVRPAVLVHIKSLNSVDGVPCVADKLSALIDASSQYTMADDRLLVITRKILEAMREQNYYLRKVMLHSLLEESDKSKK